MGKEDIVQYNLRLNLNNPYDLQLHQAILNASLDIYKSKNNYLKKVAYRGIFGNRDTTENVLPNGDAVTKRDIELLEEKMKMWVENQVLKETLSVICTAFSGKMSLAINNTDAEITEELDEAVADAALGYF